MRRSWDEKDYIHNKDVFHMDYCTILHEKLEGLHNLDFRGTNLSLDESIKKFDLSECIYLY